MNIEAIENIVSMYCIAAEEEDKHRRHLDWDDLRADVQSRGKKKDPKLKLSGKWKVFVRKEGPFKIYAVDGKWIRNNLSVIFNHGGHGFVHEFIPADEIWIATNHHDEGKNSSCGCGKGNSKVSKEYFDSCVEHEIEEFKHMKKGKPYKPAHQKALDAEKNLGLLKSMVGDSGSTPLKL